MQLLTFTIAQSHPAWCLSLSNEMSLLKTAPLSSALYGHWSGAASAITPRLRILQQLPNPRHYVEFNPVRRAATIEFNSPLFLLIDFKLLRITLSF